MTKEEEYLKLIKSKSEKEFRRECLNSPEPLPKTEPSTTCDTMEEFAKSQKSELKQEIGIIHEILSECPKSRTKQNP